MGKFFTIVWIFFTLSMHAQSLYFPPTTGSTWDTISPTDLGWCQPRIDSLYNYLGGHGTSGFLVLVDGKIALEKYFGTFTADSIHIWNSAGKSFTSTLTGVAEQEGLLNINDTVSNILGNGWTSCTTQQERQITIRNLITMTSGLNDNPTGACTSLDVTAACLQYLDTPGVRWAYHTGAYRKMEDVIATAAGVTFNNYAKTKIENSIGMHGTWFNYEFYSIVRDAARFGLLILGKGIWANDTLLRDTSYLNAMVNTSQNFNLSYGYLWWLNGKPSLMSPGLQAVLPGPLASNAPADMFAALGKDDQKIYIVPSKNMVVVRMGNSAYGIADAFSPFDNDVWGYIDSLGCVPPTTANILIEAAEMKISPNPVHQYFTVQSAPGIFNLEIYDVARRRIYEQKGIDTNAQINCEGFESGVYFLQINCGNGVMCRKIVVSH